MKIHTLVSQIQEAKNLIITTHKECDGDGLGAGLGLYHALKKIGKPVRLFCVDEVPKKYDFLEHEKYVELYNQEHAPIESTDLVLIFDTNDKRLVEPLYSELEKKCKIISFVDHHPILNEGPEPTHESIINTRAASTGEMAYFIIEKLKIPLDEKIARALYTSIVFDTQLFRFVRGSSNSHLICAKLLQFEKHSEKVHKHLFSTFSRGKIQFLSKVFKEIEYHSNYRVALSLLRSKDLKSNNLDVDDARDITDIIMNIKSVQVAIVFREENAMCYKLSLRSIQGIEVLSLAEQWNGGGHKNAAGALLKGPYNELKGKILESIRKKFEKTKTRGI